MLFLEWDKDPVMQSRGGFDIVKAISPQGIWGLVKQGEKHAATLEEQGHFEILKRRADTKKLVL